MCATSERLARSPPDPSRAQFWLSTTLGGREEPGFGHGGLGPRPNSGRGAAPGAAGAAAGPRALASSVTSPLIGLLNAALFYLQLDVHVSRAAARG